jgi:hypothetical protein
MQEVIFSDGIERILAQISLPRPNQMHGKAVQAKKVIFFIKIDFDWF